MVNIKLRNYMYYASTISEFSFGLYFYNNEYLYGNDIVKLS